MGETTDIEEQGYELRKLGDIVGTLIKPYLEKGHTLFIDNWYSSPALFLWLHNKAMNACGMVRKNRKHMPKMEEKLKKGNIQFMCSDIFLALKWCDRKEIWMLSTCHDSHMLEYSKVDYKTGKNIFKPNCVLDNKRMGAVDNKDMILSSIESIPKAKFHISLIREMVERFAGPKGRGGGRKSEEDVPLRLSGRHFPKLVTSDACRSSLPRKACVVGKNKKKRRETRYMCDECDGVGLLTEIEALTLEEYTALGLGAPRSSDTLNSAGFRLSPRSITMSVRNTCCENDQIHLMKRICTEGLFNHEMIHQRVLYPRIVHPEKFLPGKIILGIRIFQPIFILLKNLEGVFFVRYSTK
ncbi:hypothetical protein J437_LFUL005070 [Ladona fulva]|uniref:PiggyBac transposable element-derived protein domain-containing protein n=1 Tax=Ladona fulva TaxID=123851 RepID=A0A8K0PBN5_LADFU|nr:hypothetical protein J437_LFUL005070 [Ladona fulva]